MGDRWRKIQKSVQQTENKVLDFCVKHYLILFVLLVTAVGFFIRYKFLRYESGDYLGFLAPWSNELREGGGLKALANFPGDYNAPYMTILALLTYIPIRSLYTIKMVTIVFDVVLALAAAYLVYMLVKGKQRKFFAALTYAIIFLLPQVLANGSMWGQCDSIYGSFCILAIIFLFKEKYVPSFIMLGLAFAFKLQFIFILPIFVVLYILQRKFSIFNFLIIPLVNFILCLPALIAGKPFWECMTIYFQQTQTYANTMSLNFINFWSIFEVDSRFWLSAGTLLALMICATVLIWMIYKKVALTTENIMSLIVWFAIILTFVLPGMHERYLFVGEILAIVYYLIYRKNGFMVLLVNALTWVTYGNLFIGGLGDFSTHIYCVLALAEVFAIAQFTKNVFLDLKPRVGIKAKA